MFFKVKGSNINPDLQQENSCNTYGMGENRLRLAGFWDSWDIRWSTMLQWFWSLIALRGQKWRVYNWWLCSGARTGRGGAAPAAAPTEGGGAGLRTHRPVRSVRVFLFPTLMCSKGHPAFPFLLPPSLSQHHKNCPWGVFFFLILLFFLNWSFHFVSEYGQWTRR